MKKCGAIWLWFKVLALFCAASGVQVFIYSPWGLICRPVAARFYLPAILTFFFGPGILAMILAMQGVNRFYNARSRGTRIGARALVVVLGLVSMYVGVFVAFNTWGT